MAYIESHEELAEHPKTKRAARLLNTSRPAIVGHLHYLWWWCLKYAQDGDLSPYDSADIADAMLWDGDPDELIDALLNCGAGGRAGFLEKTPEGHIHVHDWWEYAGKLIERRRANKERMRGKRAGDPVDMSDARAEHVQDTTDARAGANVTKPNVEKQNVTEQSEAEPNEALGAPARAGQGQPDTAPVSEQAKPEQPYGLFVALLEELGTEESEVSPAFKSKQLSVAKRLLEQGFGEQKVRRYVRYLLAEEWRTDPIDLFTVDKGIGKWEANGSPAKPRPRASPNGNGRRNGLTPEEIRSGGRMVIDARGSVR